MNIENYFAIVDACHEVHGARCCRTSGCEACRLCSFWLNKLRTEMTHTSSAISRVAILSPYFIADHDDYVTFVLRKALLAALRPHSGERC